MLKNFRVKELPKRTFLPTVPELPPFRVPEPSDEGEYPGGPISQIIFLKETRKVRAPGGSKKEKRDKVKAAGFSALAALDISAKNNLRTEELSFRLFRNRLPSSGTI